VFARYNLPIHLIFMVLYILEIILKLTAYTPRAFFSKKINTVLFAVTCTMLCAFITDSIIAGQFLFSNPDKLYYTRNLIVLNALRGFQVIEFSKNSQSFRFLLNCIVYTIKEIGNFIVLLAIFIYVFSLLGMEIFAGKLNFDEKGHSLTNVEIDPGTSVYLPRSNFDTLLWAIITVFQILIGEEWQTVFYDCYRGAGAMVSTAYFMSVILFGNLIMLNLFLAMLLGNFEKASLLGQVKTEEQRAELLYPQGIRGIE